MESGSSSGGARGNSAANLICPVIVPSMPSISNLRFVLPMGSVLKKAYAQAEGTRDKIVIPKREPNWWMMSPLMWAPMFPLSRIALQNYPETRNRVFYSIIVAANLHAVGIFFGSGGSFGYN
mmetsp:Transcript_19145/g.30448  ORF Transcript_19145/g.30448 Transcript_19145/m.30448 type:complete len:122 (+) Transcript_19145:29-394(+)